VPRTWEHHSQRLTVDRGAHHDRIRVRVDEVDLHPRRRRRHLADLGANSGIYTTQRTSKVTTTTPGRAQYKASQAWPLSTVRVTCARGCGGDAVVPLMQGWTPWTCLCWDYVGKTQRCVLHTPQSATRCAEREQRSGMHSHSCSEAVWESSATTAELAAEWGCGCKAPHCGISSHSLDGLTQAARTMQQTTVHTGAAGPPG
jgi:hypothetical protein